MRLIARQDIGGIHSDFGLYALDGIIWFSANVKSRDELVDLFEKQYPDFKTDYTEVIDDQGNPG